MKREFFTLEGELFYIGDVEHIERTRKPDIYKRILGIKTKDNQKLFPEIRNNNLVMVEDLEEGDQVELSYSFEGSEKNDKRYNNIFVGGIVKIS